MNQHIAEKPRLIVFPFQLKQLWLFGLSQAKSCIFPVIIFLSLAVTKYVELPLLSRYDWLFILFVFVQWMMVKSGLETMDELKVITVFHFIGILLELFKTHMGSWQYPDHGFFMIAGVPLYSGFMYASVASYLCQAWRRMDVQLIHWPSSLIVTVLSGSIYVNFFTHHFIYDFRWVLSVLVVVLFWRSSVQYTVGKAIYEMPLALAFVLIGFFIWIAENIATYFGAWQYPNQVDMWSLVHIGKVSSWVLLVIVSFLIVATLKKTKMKRQNRTPFYYGGE